MDKINDGGPAFPCDPFVASKPGNESTAKRLAEGMTLRDYFAAKALPAIINSMAQLDHQKLMRLHGMEMDQIYALESYQTADAMLEARKS